MLIGNTQQCYSSFFIFINLLISFLIYPSLFFTILSTSISPLPLSATLRSLSYLFFIVQLEFKSIDDGVGFPLPASLLLKYSCCCCCCWFWELWSNYVSKTIHHEIDSFLSTIRTLWMAAGEKTGIVDTRRKRKWEKRKLNKIIQQKEQLWMHQMLMLMLSAFNLSKTHRHTNTQKRSNTEISQNCQDKNVSHFFLSLFSSFSFYTAFSI